MIYNAEKVRKEMLLLLSLRNFRTQFLYIFFLLRQTDRQTDSVLSNWTKIDCSIQKEKENIKSTISWILPQLWHDFYILSYLMGSIYVSIFIQLSTKSSYLSISLPTYLPPYLSIRLSVCLSVCVCLSACLPACLSVRACVHPSIYPSTHVSNLNSFFLSFFLSFLPSSFFPSFLSNLPSFLPFEPSIFPSFRTYHPSFLSNLPSFLPFIHPFIRPRSTPNSFEVLICVQYALEVIFQVSIFLGLWEPNASKRCDRQPDQ